MKSEFNVPSDLMFEFAGIIAENDLENEILGTTDEEQIIVAVHYEKSEFDAVQELEELVESANEEEEESEED